MHGELVDVRRETAQNRVFRYRNYRLPERMVLAMCRIHQEGYPNNISIPICNSLPEDAKIVGVHHDFYRQCFAVMVESQTFPESPDGEAIPWAEEPLNYRIVRLNKSGEEDGIPVFTVNLNQ